MKLLPIIYEGSRTAEEALDKGVVAYKVGNMYATATYILLLAKDRMLKIAPVDNDPFKPEEAWALKLLSVDTRPTLDATAISNRAIVGMVKYRDAGGGLYKVSLSAGVNKFGPLAYQIAMFESNGWLRSDKTLSEDSFSVWNKMYRMPDIYERKWLGDFPNIKKKDLIDALKASEFGEEFYNDYIRDSELLPETTTEENSFEYLINDNGKDIAEFGNLYAYKLKNPDPKVNDMFAQGKELIEEIEHRGYTGIDSTLAIAASDFFSRRYKY